MTNPAIQAIMNTPPEAKRRPSVSALTGPVRCRYATNTISPTATSHTAVRFAPKAIPMAIPTTAQMIQVSSRFRRPVSRDD